MAGQQAGIWMSLIDTFYLAIGEPILPRRCYAIAFGASEAIGFTLGVKSGYGVYVMIPNRLA
jgi:hypothetical protein